jgi:UDP-glucose 4-epimerase
VVLLFGGTGLIGGHVARALVAHGVSVAIASRKPPTDPLPEGQVQWLRCDVQHLGEVQNAFRIAQPDKVLHLAAALQFACDENPLLAARVNIGGTQNVLDAARNADVERVVFGSSVAGYGARSDIMREDDPPAPSSTSLYGAAKWFEERLGIQYAKRYGIGFVALRYCAVFGRGGSDSQGMAHVRRRIAESRNGNDVSIPEASGEERAQLTYVSDAGDMTLRALEATAPQHFVYNVAGPRENYLSLYEYAALVRQLFPGSGQVTFCGRARSLGPVDTERIQTDLGCVPRMSVRDGLRSMFAA